MTATSLLRALAGMGLLLLAGATSSAVAKPEPGSDQPKRVVRSATPARRIRTPDGGERHVVEGRTNHKVRGTDEGHISKPRPTKIACDGGHVVRSVCVCPSGARLTRRGGTCIAIAPPHPTRGPVLVAPLPPLAPVTGVTTVVPLLPPDVTGRSGPPPSPPATSPPFTVAADLAFVPDEVLATLPLASADSIENGVATRFNLLILERTPLPLLGQRLVRFRVPDRRSVPAVVAALQADATIGNPQPNFVYRAQQSANAAPTSADDLQYALAKIEFASAQNLASGKGATVGIIDTGIDVTHPDLAPDHIRTYDAINRSPIVPEMHGTAIAGIIAAHGSMRGIAPQATILGIRAFTSDARAAAQVSTSYVLAKALDWAISQRARVLNLSFAGPEDPLLHAAIDAAHGHDVIMIAAAGNNGHNASPAYPAAYPNVIAVTAVDAADRLYDKANVGDYVAIAAPGVDILAPTLSHGHELETGTSFAAAHVTAIVALMLELDPLISPKAAREALVRGAVTLAGGDHSPEFGAGRINAEASLRLVAGHQLAP